MRKAQSILILTLAMVAWLGLSMVVWAEEPEPESGADTVSGNTLAGEVWDGVKSAASSAVEFGKEKGPIVADKVQRYGTAAYEKVKEKAPDVLDAAKSGLKKAGTAVQNFYNGSQDEFMDWFADQTGTERGG